MPNPKHNRHVSNKEVDLSLSLCLSLTMVTNDSPNITKPLDSPRDKPFDPAQAKRPVPRKLNPGIIEALSEYIRKGNYATVACSLVGIDDSTLWHWTDQAKKDEQDGIDSLYTELIIALKRAEAEAEDLMIQTARNAAVEKKDGYLAITVNERRHPERWGRKDRTRVDITETKKVLITHVDIVLTGSQEIIEGPVLTRSELSRTNEVEGEVVDANERTS